MALKSRIDQFIEDTVCSDRDSDILNGLERLLDSEKTLLDVGCGDGRITEKIQKKLKLKIQGIDIYPHKKPKLPITVFDGEKIPFPDNSFDSVLFVDVLHHIKDMNPSLKEAFRVARKSVIIKDHCCENGFETSVLKIADYFGNFSHRSNLPFNFKSDDKWSQIFGDNPVEKITWRSTIFPGIFVRQAMYKINLAKKESKSK